jgi:hypothetical protein
LGQTGLATDRRATDRRRIRLGHRRCQPAGTDAKRWSGQAEAILSPVLNTAIIHQFLDQFSRALASDVHAALIWDGAGFPRAHDVKVPANSLLKKWHRHLACH